MGTGFQAIEEQASRFSVSEKQILKKLNQISDSKDIEDLDEICLLRSYNIAAAVSSYKKPGYGCCYC